MIHLAEGETVLVYEDRAKGTQWYRQRQPPVFVGEGEVTKVVKHTAFVKMSTHTLRITMISGRVMDGYGRKFVRHLDDPHPHAVSE